MYGLHAEACLFIARERRCQATHPSFERIKGGLGFKLPMRIHLQAFYFSGNDACYRMATYKCWFFGLQLWSSKEIDFSLFLDSADFLWFTEKAVFLGHNSTTHRETPILPKIRGDRKLHVRTQTPKKKTRGVLSSFDQDVL